MAKTAVAIVENNAVAVADDDDLFLKYAGVGGENVTSEDKITPRLRIISSQSKELQRGDVKYIKGAEAGQILRDDTKALIDGEVGLEIVVAKFQRTWNIYENDRFRAALLPGDELLRGKRQEDNNKWYLRDGREVRDTANFFVVLITGGRPKPAMISMASSQWKKAKIINSYLAEKEVLASTGKWVNQPWAATVWSLTTAPEKNDKGSWFGWNPVVSRTLDYKASAEDRVILEAGLAFAAQVGAGKVVVRGEDSDQASDRDDLPF